jgi:hypothetical protein
VSIGRRISKIGALDEENKAARLERQVAHEGALDMDLQLRRIILFTSNLEAMTAF